MNAIEERNNKIAVLAQPTATVRRGGVERVVRPVELVLGDLVRLSIAASTSRRSKWSAE